MSVEDEYPKHQTLPGPQMSPSLLPPPRPYSYAPPTDYNVYHGHDFRYGYRHPDGVYGSSPSINPLTSSALYLNPGMLAPQVNFLVPGVNRQLYYYDPSQLPPQYYLPLSQNITYSQMHPRPPSNHSSMIATQLPVTTQDTKRDLQVRCPSQAPLCKVIREEGGGGLEFLTTQLPRRVVPFWRSFVLTSHANGNSGFVASFVIDDIFGHAVEFSGDQHGSRFIQQKLESATSEEKQVIFDEIVPMNAFSLMVDVFGNYACVIQKFFEHGSQSQKVRLAQTMEGRIQGLSQQMYGCRVVQKAIEFVLPEQQSVFVKELEPQILKCVKDANGNHVIQKLVERVSPDNLGFIKHFRGNVYDLATHPYGCRVLQRCFEHLPEETTRPLMDELHKCATSLMQDQFGNYVMQYVLEHGKPHDRTLVISKLYGQILVLARHKFASNVCEKALACADPDTRRRLIDEILVTKPDGVTPITGMMKDQYANYVLQRAMNIAAADQREILFNKVAPQVQSMRRHSGVYTKHLTAIERLIENHAQIVKT
ncbi:hypothetical protein C0993_009999 [Termitomyces sp. T159_Od127]|nr:hypothetical protein C0993_009999 [Termitomyces sp. T159_Od127]